MNTDIPDVGECVTIHDSVENSVSYFYIEYKLPVNTKFTVALSPVLN